MVAATTGTLAGGGAGSAARDCHPKYAKLAPARNAADATAPMMIFHLTTVFPCEAGSRGLPAFGNACPAVGQHDHSVPLRSQDGFHGSKRLLANGDVACAVGSAGPIE
jgi:hypothetical protein